MFPVGPQGGAIEYENERACIRTNWLHLLLLSYLLNDTAKKLDPPDPVDPVQFGSDRINPVRSFLPTAQAGST